MTVLASTCILISFLVRTEPFVPLTEMAEPGDYRHALAKDESICDLYPDDEHDPDTDMTPSI